MFHMNKKAVSLIVSYVLLISIGLSIAGLVFGWLKFYANIEEPVKCPDGVSLIIMEASYSQPNAVGGEGLSLNLTVQNRGRFDIAGYVIRANNRIGSTIGIAELYRTNSTLPPGNSTSHLFVEEDFEKINYDRVCFIEIQPMVLDESGEALFCTQISTKNLDCYS